MSWIGREAPARIVELMACVDISELPPPSVRSALEARKLELMGDSSSASEESLVSLQFGFSAKHVSLPPNYCRARTCPNRRTRRAAFSPPRSIPRHSTT
jgi:hypothetical protein